MKFEDLQAASTAIKTTPIKGKEYAQVNERIKVFRMLFPNGTISTEIVNLTTNDKGKGIVIFKATALNEQGQIIATGHAHEIEGSSNINNTSYIENAETSAVGRCLGMIGIGIDVSIATYEEVATAVKQQEEQQAKPQAKKTAAAAPKKAEPTPPPAVAPDNGLPFEIDTETFRDKFRRYVGENKLNKNQVAQILTACKLQNDSPDSEWEKALLYAIAANGGVQT